MKQFCQVKNKQAQAVGKLAAEYPYHTPIPTHTPQPLKNKLYRNIFRLD